MNNNRRPGLTLLELLIVLVILAIMTTIAVQSTDMLLDQSRYDVTQRTLQNIQDAIIGPANQRDSDGTPSSSGFLQDMGRLPQPVYVSGVLQGDPLRELYDNTVILTASMYSVQFTTVPVQSLPAPTGTTVLLAPTGGAITLQMPCGWRGPYLRLPGGSNGRLIDGWGNPFDSILYQASPLIANSPPLAGQPINIVRSRGADGQVDPVPLPAGFAPLNIDMYVPDQGVPPVVFAASPPSASFTNSALGSVTISCQEYNAYNGTPATIGNPVPTPTTPGGNTPNTNEAVQVVLLAPVNGVLTPFAPSMVNGTLVPAGGATAVPLSGTTGNPATVSFLNVPVGPRAVQAFHYNTTTGTVLKRSPIQYLTVPPGGVPSKTLILQ
jgi:prepilin-type N-terminal cleavage/methylation domain-containing protein